jgi:sphinganine-1-phosphate aldolase
MTFVTETNALLRFAQMSNDFLDNRYLRHIKNIIFILVLLNYWSKLYNQVLIGGPLRAIQDLKAYVIKVNMRLDE